MTDLGHAVLGWLVAVSCQLVVPFVVAVVLDRLLPARAWPELRAAVWGLVALKLLLPPTLGTAWHAPIAAAVAPSPTLLAGAELWYGWLLAIWAGGALAWVAIATAAQRRVLRAARRWAVPTSAALRTELLGLAARIGLRRLPSILTTDASVGTFVLARPRQWLVIDRVQLRALDAVARRHLLLHELTHARRRDAQVALVGTLLQAIWWFHPLAWLLMRRLHALRELCCDQAVVRVLGGDPSPYRTSLLRAARALLSAAPARQHAFAPWGGLVLQRLRALERPCRATAALRRSLTVLLVAMLAVTCVPLATPRIDPNALDLRDLRGCLQRRFAVLAALARSEAEMTPPPTTHR